MEGVLHKKYFQNKKSVTFGLQNMASLSVTTGHFLQTMQNSGVKDKLEQK
jgi:hypothetical protein